MSKYFQKWKERMDNPNYENKNIEKSYLNKAQMNQFLKIESSLLKLEKKQFIELKDRELKDSEVEIKREIL